MKQNKHNFCQIHEQLRKMLNITFNERTKLKITLC
jgi:hypothetical protein